VGGVLTGGTGAAGGTGADGWTGRESGDTGSGWIAAAAQPWQVYYLVTSWLAF